MATVVYTPTSNDILHQVELDMVTRKQISEPVHLVQFDDRLPILEVHLYQDDIPYACPSGSDVSVRFEKPDNKIVYNPVLGWNSDRTIIYVQVTLQMTTAYGDANAILEVKSGDKTAGSGNFTVVVERNPVQEDSIESTDEVISLAGYADAAAQSAAKAGTYAQTAQTAQTSAAASASTATTKATEASQSAAQAVEAKNTATAKAEVTETQAKLSQSYAVGTENVVRPNDKTDNSKAYAELAQALVVQAQALLEQAERIIEAHSSGGIIPVDTRTFEELPEDPQVGYMYNISNPFTSDDRFVDGTGFQYPAGTNVYWSTEEKWDVLVGNSVFGVKGAAETEYRDGYVNLSPNDIGLIPVNLGGTGEDSGFKAANAMINYLASASEAPVDTDYFISQEVGGNLSDPPKTQYVRRPVNALWNYIRSKKPEVLMNYCTLINDWNDVASNGWFMGFNLPNAPTANTWFYGIGIAHANTYVREILYQFAGNNDILSEKNSRWERIKDNGTWGEWYRTGSLACGIKITDWNDAIQNGWYYSSLDAANKPINENVFYCGFVTTLNISNIRQIVWRIAGGNDPNSILNAMYERIRSSGTWGSWSRMNQTMNGATSTTNGTAGLVPQPMAGDNSKVLFGNGTWGDLNSKAYRVYNANGNSLIYGGSETITGLILGHPYLIILGHPNNMDAGSVYVLSLWQNNNIGYGNASPIKKGSSANVSFEFPSLGSVKIINNSENSTIWYNIIG